MAWKRLRLKASIAATRTAWLSTVCSSRSYRPPILHRSAHDPRTRHRRHRRRERHAAGAGRSGVDAACYFGHAARTSSRHSRICSAPLTGTRPEVISGWASIFATVQVLLNPCGPPAVFWRVVAVIVDTINAGSFRPSSHIRKEVLEHLPAVAHSNSPGTIVAKAPVFRVGATILDSRPSLVLRCCFST